MQDARDNSQELPPERWFALYSQEHERAERLQAQVAELESARDQLQAYAGDLRRTYAELRWWLGGLNALHEASTSISAALDEELVVARVLESLVGLVPYDHARIYLTDKEGALACRASRWAAGLRDAELSAAFESRFEEALRAEEPRGTVLAPPQVAIIVQLRTRGRPVGGFVLVRAAANRFTAEEARLLELFAAVAAVALENARLYQETQRLATVDPLTDLFNRRYFWQNLTQEVARSRRHGYPIGVLMADLDHFKQVNDRYGHPKADEVLREMARAAREQLRRTDVLARLGGEEFGVILPNASAAAVGLVGEKLRAAVADVRVPDARGGDVRITMSVGGVSLPHTRVDPDLLVDLADQALLRAKQAGRNRVVVELPERNSDG